MAAKDKLEACLNEARTMVLGGQVVLGFQVEATFQPKFAALPQALQAANAAAVGLLIAGLVLLLAPIPYHRLVADGDATEDMLSFTTGAVAAAPLPFAACIGMDVAIVSRTAFGVAAAVILAGVALFLWYGVELMRRTKPQPLRGSGKTDIHEKIKTINTEARIILPGVQALLGFQFTAFLMDGFDRLPEFAKSVHLAGLVALSLAVIFLMAPAAYHRIAARGEDRPDVDRFAVIMVLGSLVPLALGLAADLYLALGWVAGWAAWTAAAAIASIAVMLAAWFGYPLWRRA